MEKIFLIQIPVRGHNSPNHRLPEPMEHSRGRGPSTGGLPNRGMVLSQIRQFLDFGAEFVSRFLKDHARITCGPSINF